LYVLLWFIGKDIKCDSMAELKKKGFKRRFIFRGWNNYTQFEKDKI
jgi:hypothetical protein